MKKDTTLPTFQCYSLCLLIATLFACPRVISQNPFPDLSPIYQDDVVARVDITLPADSLAVILASGNEESDYHFHATFRFDNGTIRDTIENIGFRLRGNTSRFSAKKSFKVSFNTYESGRKWYGVEKLNLNGEHNDPSISRSKVCWDLLREIGVPAPRASHVRLFINDNYYGLYANIEHIDEEFVGTRFGNKKGNLYKCLWPADLNYLGDDPNLYKLMAGDRRVYELKTNEEEDDYSDLAHFIDVLNNMPIDDLRCELEAIFNINSFLLSMAFDILSGNWDGPLYNKNNFYLYHNQATGKFEYIPFDLDNTFGIDWFNIDWAERDMYNWGPSNEDRPLYSRILEVPAYRDRFSYYMNKIIEATYTETALFPKIDHIKALIEPHVPADPFYPLDYGFNATDFNNSFVQTLPYNHTKAGLKPFISNRLEATNNQLQLNDIDPIIDHISNNQPNLNQDMLIQAFAEDDQGITSMEVCYQLDGAGPVHCVGMSDDGQHFDNVAGDGWYGAIIPPLDSTASLTYYIQATDQDDHVSLEPICGTRQLFVGSSSITLAINEFMASNDNTITDEAGEYEDWVEIHNYGTTPIFLGDRYLSDDPEEATKWQFPNTWIQAGEFLLIWADDDEGQGDLHANFKLSAGGEFIGIFDTNDASNGLIDGLEFGAQETNQAYGRLPNGTGPFQNLQATPGSSNEAPSANQELGGVVINYQIFPNPSRALLYLEADQPLSQAQEVVLYNAVGQPLLKETWEYKLTMNIAHLPNGLYFLGIWEDGQFKHLGKVIKK